MTKKRYKDWIEYYRIKGLKGGNLVEVSGYSHGLAQLTRRGFKDITDTARNFLTLKTTDVLLDVGCGTGLITVQLIDAVGVIVGIDASAEMIGHASKESKFIKVVAMADNLPFPDGSFNKIFCHSIFQYFPNHRYAAKVIAEMLRVMKPGGRCLIMDIPDISKKKEYMKAKIYDAHNLKRVFYNKQWFTRLVSDAEVFERRIRDYGNSQFRFNVLIRK